MGVKTFTLLVVCILGETHLWRQPPEVLGCSRYKMLWNLRGERKREAKKIERREIWNGKQKERRGEVWIFCFKIQPVPAASGQYGLALDLRSPWLGHHLLLNPVFLNLRWFERSSGQLWSGVGYVCTGCSSYGGSKMKGGPQTMLLESSVRFPGILHLAHRSYLSWMPWLSVVPATVWTKRHGPRKIHLGSTVICFK